VVTRSLGCRLKSEKKKFSRRAAGVYVCFVSDFLTMAEDIFRAAMTEAPRFWTVYIGRMKN